MNNEPYGWHCFIGKGKEEQDFLFINGKGVSKPDASWDKVIPLYTHPVKELHLSLQKDKETGELLAVTYTDDEHRIVEVLWEKPPVKELTDEEIELIADQFKEGEHWKQEYKWSIPQEDFVDFARAILREASEK